MSATPIDKSIVVNDAAISFETNGSNAIVNPNRVIVNNEIYEL